MAALNASCLTNRRVYVYPAAWAIAGGGFGVGDDTTGDGTAAAPYSTPKEACKQWQIAEGVAAAPIEVRMVSEAGETNDYGDVLIGPNGEFPLHSRVAPLVFRGWKKSWGDVDLQGKWTQADGSEKPSLKCIRASGSVTAGFTNPVIKDLRFNQASPVANTYLYFAGQTAAGMTALFVGCHFSSVATRAVIKFWDSAFPIYGYVGCVFDGSFIDTEVINGKHVRVGAHSCTFNINGAKLYAMNTNNSSGLMYANMAFCIVNQSGAGNFVLFQTGSGDFVNIMGAQGCRINLSGGAKYMKVATGTEYATVAAAQAASGANNAHEFTTEGDPLLNADLTLQAASPLVDKGGFALGGNYQHFDACFDNSGLKLHSMDFLGYPWADTDIQIPLGNGIYQFGTFSMRSLGAFQDQNTMVPPIAEIVWPKGIVNVSTPYVVAKIGQDPDGSGTCQPKFLQADNATMINNLLGFDAWPLTVDGTNGKIDFKEDGGGELTATLTPGNYNTDTLAAEIKAQLEVAGAGTYSVTYDDGTEKWTIAVSGGATNVQFLWQTGTNVANTAAVFLGFRQLDSASQPSHVSDDEVIRNDYDASLAYEYSSDYDGVSNPAVNGTWFALGTGAPGNGGIEGTNGVACGAGTRYVRCNLGNVAPVDKKYHACLMANGTLRSSAVEAP